MSFIEMLKNYVDNDKLFSVEEDGYTYFMMPNGNKYKVPDNDDPLNSNIERIQFAAGLYPIFYKNVSDYVIFEEEHKDKNCRRSRPDVVLFNSTTSNSSIDSKIYALIENKNVSTKKNYESCRSEALNGLAGYVKTLNQELHDEFFLTIVYFKPDFFLSTPRNIQKYLDAEATVKNKHDYKPTDILNTYGIVIETYKIHKNKLPLTNTVEDITTELSYTSLTSATLPIIMPLRGYKTYQSDDPVQQAQDIRMIVRLEELKKLPFFNPNGNAGNHNTRNIDLEDIQKRTPDFIETLIDMFNSFIRSNKVKTTMLSKTGSNDRQLVFNQNETLIDHSFDDRVVWVSSDISLVDGQHSSQIYLDILNELNFIESEIRQKESLDIIPTIYKLLSKDGQHSPSKEQFMLFKEFVSTIKIGISAQGTSDIEEAKRIAKNQNSRKDQSKQDMHFSKYRFKIKHILDMTTNRYADSNYDLSYTKSFANHPELNRKINKMHGQLISFYTMLDIHKALFLDQLQSKRTDKVLKDRKKEWMQSIADDDIERSIKSHDFKIEYLSNTRTIASSNEKAFKDFVSTYNDRNSFLEYLDEFEEGIKEADSFVNLQSGYDQIIKAVSKCNTGKNIKVVQSVKDKVNACLVQNQYAINQHKLLITQGYSINNDFLMGFRDNLFDTYQEVLSEYQIVQTDQVHELANLTKMLTLCHDKYKYKLHIIDKNSSSQFFTLIIGIAKYTYGDVSSQFLQKTAPGVESSVTMLERIVARFIEKNSNLHERGFGITSLRNTTSTIINNTLSFDYPNHIPKHVVNIVEYIFNDQITPNWEFEPFTENELSDHSLSYSHNVNTKWSVPKDDSCLDPKSIL